MGIIVVVYAAFGLTVSEVKTEIICLRTEGMLEVTTIYSVETAGQMDNQTNGFAYLGKCQPRCRPVHRGRPAHMQQMAQLPEVRPRTIRPTERPPRAQDLDARSQGTRDHAVRLRHVVSARVPQ